MLKDETGSVFGKLRVIARAQSKPDGTANWLCVCECGSHRIIAGTGLRAGRHKSCGCASPRFASERLLKHGMSKSRTYKIWVGMLQRCSETGRKNEYYRRGITVCERWHSFENFLKDMGEAENSQSIDRIDGLGNYEPGNCRWASSEQQGNNKNNNRMLEFRGDVRTLANWAKMIGVKQNTLFYRIKRGMPVERALSKTV